MCVHENTRVQWEVTKIGEGEAFKVEFRLTCAECGEGLRFSMLAGLGKLPDHESAAKLAEAAIKKATE